MPQETFEEKTESPSPRRRHQAREKGNVTKSTEVNSVLVLLGGLLFLHMFGGWMSERIIGFFRGTFLMIANPTMELADLVELMSNAVVTMLSVCAPVCAGILFIGVASNLLQIGILFTGEPLIPKLEKISPLSGMKRMFSPRSLVELAKSLLKLIIIGFVAYVTIRGEFNRIMTIGHSDLRIITMLIIRLSFTITFRIGLVLIVLAILDYAYQRYEHEKNLRMTKQEVKEERKQMEGDPQIKSRVRALQREMSRRRMMQEVPQATVVVTNPTYIAIALRYVPDEMETPMVLAKGKRVIAERIKTIASENDIPVVEDKPLARAMYDKVEPGDPIPLEFFTAVAEILAYVYRLKGNRVAA